jgi:ABC-2 type transport system permease protein
MRLHRIQGMTLRYFYLFYRSYDRLIEVFYWPVIDLFLWGITSSYILKFAPSFEHIVFTLVSGVVFWNIIIRGQSDVCVSMLEEMWNKNMINLFVSPLKFGEWICSFLILASIKAATAFIFASIFAVIFYHVRLISLGWYLIPAFFLLIMTGWSLGFTIAAFILRYGTKVQTLAWTFVWIIAPFSAVYFPQSILPDWAQKVAMVMPASYIFEANRELIATGYLDMNKLYMSLLLNIIYFILSLLFLKNSFEKVLQKGLVKVY